MLFLRFPSCRRARGRKSEVCSRHPTLDRTAIVIGTRIRIGTVEFSGGILPASLLLIRGVSPSHMAKLSDESRERKGKIQTKKKTSTPLLFDVAMVGIRNIPPKNHAVHLSMTSLLRLLNPHNKLLKAHRVSTLPANIIIINAHNPAPGPGKSPPVTHLGRGTQIPPTRE